MQPAQGQSKHSLDHRALIHWQTHMEFIRERSASSVLMISLSNALLHVLAPFIDQTRVHV